MQKELLCPAGNMDCLHAAISSGADAVYLGGKSFGARRFAGNFDDEELKEAIHYAHLYGVKVYVTVNTIIYNDEVEKLISYIDYLYNIGTDSLIMQDIGMISLIRKLYPDLEITASTQMHNHNNQDIAFLKELGIKKVVLDRELSLEEISRLDSSIEKEVFIHGALCNSYSGCCLFSSMNGGRSGNRGECTQPCRLPYRLIKNDKPISEDFKYLLSTKELNVTSKFSELMASDVVSFKIEGRMKSPSYVGYVTKIYRKLIDNYYLGKPLTLSEDEEDNLKILFSRKFTMGYLFNDKVMNIDTSNHQGLEIGKVVSVNSRKIKIKLDKALYQEDGIRFKNSNLGMTINYIYNDRDLLVSKALKGDIIYLDNKINLTEKDIVLKTSSPYLEKQILLANERKIPVNISVQNDEITYTDNLNHQVSIKIPLYASVSRPTSKSDIEEKLTKLGNTPFIKEKININIPGNTFISMKDLNNARRYLIDKLIEERTKVARKKKESHFSLDYKESTNYPFEVSLLARTEEQVKAGLKEGVSRIYMDYDLYQKYQDKKEAYLKLPRVVEEYNYDAKNILITELGGVYKYRNINSHLVGDYFLNVVNNYSIKFLLDNHLERVCLSPEINYDNLEDYIKDKIEIIVYGRIELMVTKSSPVKELTRNYPCPEDKYYLEDINKNRYPLVHDKLLTHIMHYKNINYLDKISYYKKIGIRGFRLELFDENYDETIKLIKKIKE